MYKTLLLIFFLGITTCVYGQSTNDLTEEEKEQIQNAIKDRLTDFQDNLEQMADKKNSQYVRTSAHKSNRLLFLGKCEPYTVINLSTDEVEKKEPVQMETSSISNDVERKRKQSMKRYFINIMNNRAYANIRVTQSKAVRVDNIRKVGDGKYVAVAHIHQYFTGYGGDRQILYSDETEKAVGISIEVSDVETSMGVDRKIDIRLGDMKVVLTDRLK